MICDDIYPAENFKLTIKWLKVKRTLCVVWLLARRNWLTHCELYCLQKGEEEIDRLGVKVCSSYCACSHDPELLASFILLFYIKILPWRPRERDTRFRRQNIDAAFKNRTFFRNTMLTPCWLSRTHFGGIVAVDGLDGVIIGARTNIII